MFRDEAFTLIEIIVAMIILSILAAIATPNYANYVIKGAAQAAQSNLVAIHHAEKTFYFNNAYYCGDSPLAGRNCGSNLTNINTNLGLAITDTYFTYACVDPKRGTDGDTGSDFKCTATSISDNTFILTVSSGPIILG